MRTTFWEHQISDDPDFERGDCYIHYNPVQRKLMKQVAEWHTRCLITMRVAACIAKIGVPTLEWSAQIRGNKSACASRTLHSLACMHIGFTKIAFRAKGLQVVQNGFSTFAPWDFMVNLKLNPRSESRACTAGATGKTVTL